MKYQFNSGINSPDRGEYLVFCDSVFVNKKTFSFALYLLGCNGSWNQPKAYGDICTKEFKTTNLIKVGEWAGVGSFLEMNIYQSGLYANSKLDPSLVEGTKKEEQLHLKYKDFEHFEIPVNTKMHRYLKTIDRLIELAKYR
jgi:hypothetical protein